MKINLRLLYLYLFSFVGLLVVVIGSINLVNIGLKTFVFKNADSFEAYPVALVKTDVEPQPSMEEQQAWQERENQRQKERDLTQAIAMIVVGAPLYFYHWKTIQKEEKNLL